jgi:hypothetical protein
MLVMKQIMLLLILYGTVTAETTIIYVGRLLVVPGLLPLQQQQTIIAVDKSSLKELKELLDVDFVMKEGKVYKNK